MLPQRTWQHIAEAAAYKLLQAKLPEKWMLRTVTERDYGNDFLIEIVDDNGMMTGQSAWVQLKARKTVKWNRFGKMRLGDVKKSTTNYWRLNTAPVFIFMVDLQKEDIYFLCAEYYIRRNFSTYLKEGNFAYYFDRFHDRFDCPEGEEMFLLHLKKQEDRRQFESEITIFLTNLEGYQHIVLGEEQVQLSVGGRYILRTLTENYNFLCDYFHLKPLSASFLQKLLNSVQSKADFEVIREYCLKEREILFCIRKLLDSELAYWTFTCADVYYYVHSLTANALGTNISD